MQTAILQKLHQQLSDFKLQFNDNQQKVRISSVAMVFRVNPALVTNKTLAIGNTAQLLSELKTIEQHLPEDKSMFSLLFLQRAFNEKDPNSGNLCFPGGKCDGNQNDLSAAIRETHEQTALVLEESMLIGKMNRIFYARKTRKQVLYMTVYLFLLRDPNSQIKLNEHQVIDFKWVDFKEILTPEKKIIEMKVNAIGFLLSIAERLAQEFNTTKEQIQQNFEGAAFPSLDIGMSFLLFGLTFYVLMDLFKIIIRDNEQPLKQKGMFGQIVKTIDKASKIEIRFNENLMHRDLISKKIVQQYKRLRILPDLKESRL